MLLQMAEKDEFEYHQKELEKLANPIMTKLYQQGGMPGMWHCGNINLA